MWQKDLESETDKNFWLNIISNTGKTLTEAKGKNIMCKVLHRYYFTPSKLKRIGLLDHDLCWRCKEQKGTLLHTLWDKTLHTIEEGLGFPIPQTPKLCLLNDKNEVKGVTVFFRLLTCISQD